MTDIRSDLARFARVLARLGLLDAFGHLSARLPDSDAVVATPGWRTRPAIPPSRIKARDVLTLTLEGVALAGDGAASPLMRLDLALYRARPDLGAVALLAPPLTCAFGIARRPMAPLFHTWAELADVIAVYETEGLPFRDSQIWELVEATRDARIVHLPGLGVLVLGRDLVDLVTTSYYLEFSLARSNFIAAVLGANQLRTLTPADLARIIPRRGGPQHHREFFLSLDPGPASEVLGPQPPPADVEAHVRWKMALACRMLAAQETLVAFLEHVSHRLPDGRWLMTPIKNFALMTPDDMIVLDEHDRWLSGPAPAHFVHFHGDLFRARPDVQAVVHVHDVFGRVFVQSGRSAASIWRNGATDARRSMAVYQEPDLLFDPEPRTAAIAALDGYDILHELSHGTDYVAGTLEEATVRAIHREELLRMHVLASLLGEPRLLSEATVRDLEDTGPEWATWWIFYGSRLGTPYQSTSWFPMTTKFL